MNCELQRGASTVEYLLFVAAIVLPLAGWFFWMMTMMLRWFLALARFVDSPIT